MERSRHKTFRMCPALCPNRRATRIQTKKVVAAVKRKHKKDKEENNRKKMTLSNNKMECNSEMNPFELDVIRSSHNDSNQDAELQ